MEDVAKCSDDSFDKNKTTENIRNKLMALRAKYGKFMDLVGKTEAKNREERRVSQEWSQ